MIIDLLFYLFATTIIISAFVVVIVKNPVHSVLFLILSFFNAAGLFLLLGAEFIAMLVVIVYVGAVAVLFLFVVMMLNIHDVVLQKQLKHYLPVSLVVSGVVFIEIYLIYHQATGLAITATPESFSTSLEFTNTERLGQLLFTQYAFPFELAGLILLVAMIGAIVLTLRHKSGTRKQIVADQVSRKASDCIEIISMPPVTKKEL